MNVKSLRNAAILGAALLTLTGCAPQIPMMPSLITPDLVSQDSPSNPYYKGICVKSGGEYKGSMDGYGIDVVPDAMVIALNQTLYNNNLQALDNDCRYELTATVTHIGHDLFTMPFAPVHAYSTVQYTLVRLSDKQTVIDKSIDVDYAHEFEFEIPAYMGTMHTIWDAASGSVQENIKEFVQTLG